MAVLGGEAATAAPTRRAAVAALGGEAAAATSGGEAAAAPERREATAKKGHPRSSGRGARKVSCSFSPSNETMNFYLA